MLRTRLPTRIWTRGRRALGFRMGFRMGFGLAVVACCGTGRPAGADTAPTVENLHQQFFESRVRPLLSTKCQECHGDGIAEAGLRLDSRQALIRGADSGPVVVLGKAAESRLLAVVRHADNIAMPPEGKLSDDEISVLETWISAGAPWSGPGGDDDTSTPAAGPVDMQQRLKDALRDHWAFQPLLQHEPPAPAPQAPPEWAHSRIDRFILSAATAAGAPPSPAASPRDLVRRVWFDLTGMPPPAAEVDAFAAQPTEESYQVLALQQLIIDKPTRLVGGQTEQHPILGPWVAAASGSDAKVPSRLARLLDADAAGQPASTLNTVIRDELVSARPGSLAELAEAYGRVVMRIAPDWAGGPAVASDETDDARAVRELLGAAGTPFVVLETEAMRVANMAEQTEFRRRQLNVTKHQAEAVGGPPRAMVLIDRPQPQDSPILLRGSPARRGDVVKRRMPMLLGGTEVGAGSSGRLDLARALVAPGNPLTARMIVNWAWTHHLGGGLVPAPGDLGLRGEAPAHRQLLDDLARRFMDEGGWSLRWLHREIVTSRTFRQSSAARENLADRDPDNRLFARANRRRLDWEAWRDSMLVAADTLDRVHCGGRGVDPLAVESMSVRSIYGRLDRQDVPGLLRTFDIANPDTAVHVRVRTTVPQQSLAVLNSELVVSAARRLAARVQAEVADPARDDLRVDSLWRAALSRSPSAEERDAALTWLAAEPLSDTSAFGRYERLAQAVLAVAEFQFID